ncbi:MAG: N-acetylmuramidase family protein [Hyphomonadaceae bacterium JAD_PAG50586_4]|nr:MAG: N-acetylmuramidase family protein [Hyphomonadaceae bacterium JAD_PAG50586_4]
MRFDRRRVLALGAAASLAACAHAGSDTFLAGLAAGSQTPLSDGDYQAAAALLEADKAAVQAVVEVESGAHGGFGADNRPIILFEPHVFSRLTQARFDQAHPNISYRAWDRSRYPAGQEARWAQLREAYGLDGEAALQATSWGCFSRWVCIIRTLGSPTCVGSCAKYLVRPARNYKSGRAG